MPHPRTGERLLWERVVDYCHVAEPIWTMAALLFGQGSGRYHAWAKRILRVLKTEPRGANRVLHSAAAFAVRARLGKTRSQKFTKAYRYLQRRTKGMRYSEYRKPHIPLGSGITEAACKAMYTQRLKLSGMRWTKDGAQHVLDPSRRAVQRDLGRYLPNVTGHAGVADSTTDTASNAKHRQKAA